MLLALAARRVSGCSDHPRHAGRFLGILVAWLSSISPWAFGIWALGSVALGSLSSNLWACGIMLCMLSGSLRLSVLWMIMHIMFNYSRRPYRNMRAAIMAHIPRP